MKGYESIVTQLRDADEQAGGRCCSFRKEAATVIEDLLSMGVRAADALRTQDINLDIAATKLQMAREDIQRLRSLLERSLKALLYHTAQTRPIYRTDEVIMTIRKELEGT
jgi:hypothetical protein